MTKLTIEQTIDENWMSDLECMTKQEAIDWINTNVPEGYIFYVDIWGDRHRGCLKSSRLETDEEEQKREEAYAVEQARRKKAREDDILMQAKKIMKERKLGDN